MPPAGSSSCRCACRDHRRVPHALITQNDSSFALLNSVIANLNAANNSSTRTLYALGRIRLLPSSFALLTKRSGSPYMGLWAQMLITIGVSLWLGLQYTPYTAFALIAT